MTLRGSHLGQKARSELKAGIHPLSTSCSGAHVVPSRALYLQMQGKRSARLKRACACSQKPTQPEAKFASAWGPIWGKIDPLISRYGIKPCQCYGGLSRLVEIGAEAAMQYSASGALRKYP